MRSTATPCHETDRALRQLPDQGKMTSQAKPRSFQAVDTHSPYTDTRPNQTPGTAETHEYHAYFLKNDQQAGTQSAVVSISAP